MKRKKERKKERMKEESWVTEEERKKFHWQSV